MWRAISDYDGNEVLINLALVERITVVRQHSAPHDVYVEFSGGQKVHSTLNFQETVNLLNLLKAE